MTSKHIDHFILLAQDQEAARDAYVRLGFTMTPVVTHPELGSTNSVAIFPETYLEVLHLGTSGPEMRALLDPRLAIGPGLCAVCLNADTLEEEEARLTAAGLNPGPKVRSWRPVPLPDGTEGKTASGSMWNWKTERPYLSFFFSEHRKPEMIFIKDYMTHENGAVDLIGITSVSDDPAGDRDYYERCYAASAASVDQTGFTMRGGRGDFMTVLTKPAAQARYPGLLDDLDLGGTGGFPVALHYAVRSLDAVRALLATRDVPFSEIGGSVAVPRAYGQGAIVVFEES